MDEKLQALHDALVAIGIEIPEGQNTFEGLIKLLKSNKKILKAHDATQAAIATGAEEETPEGEPAPTADPEPTADPAPTADPEPTADPAPTADPEPKADPAPAAAKDTPPVGDKPEDKKKDNTDKPTGNKFVSVR